MCGKAISLLALVVGGGTVLGGTGGPPDFRTVPWALGERPLGDVFLADFDGDGDRELGYRRDASGHAFVNAAPNANFLIREVSPGPAYVTTVEIPTTLPECCGRVVVGDFDGNGAAEFVQVPLEDAGGSLTFFWLGNSGDGWVTQEVGPFPVARGLAPNPPRDLNNDGFDDLVLSSFLQSFVSYGSASGLTALIEIPVALPAEAPSVFDRTPLHSIADLDGDGLDDLIFSIWREIDLNSSVIEGYVVLFGSATPGGFVEPTLMSADAALPVLGVVEPDDGSGAARAFLLATSDAAVQHEVQLPMVRGQSPSLIERAYVGAGFVEVGGFARAELGLRDRLLDLDGDGALDRFGGGQPVTYAAFTDDAVIAGPANASGWNALLDVGGDGDLDLINLRGFSEARGLAGRPASYPGGASPVNSVNQAANTLHLLAEDLNSDGHPDLIGEVGFRNPGNLEQTWPALPSVPNLGLSFQSVLARHPARERPVLIWGERREGGSQVLANDLDDSTSPAPTIQLAGNSDDAVPLAAVDLDGDQFDEVLFIRRNPLNGSRNLAVLEASGSWYALRQALPLDGESISIVAGDFTGDGLMDVAVGELNAGPNGTLDILVFGNDGAGGLTALGALASPVKIYAMHVVDLDGNGRDDLLASEGLSPEADLDLWVWLQPETGGLVAAEPRAIGAGVVRGAREIHSADFDRDGIMDLYLETDRNADPISRSMVISDPLSASPGYWDYGSPRTNPAALVADLNRDGRPDLVRNRNGAQLVIDYSQPPPFCPADLNGDSVQDLADINAFVTLFLEGDLAADANGDGFLDTGDIRSFVDDFLAGCQS